MEMEGRMRSEGCGEDEPPIAGRAGGVPAFGRRILSLSPITPVIRTLFPGTLLPPMIYIGLSYIICLNYLSRYNRVYQ